MEAHAITKEEFERRLLELRQDLESRFALKADLHAALTPVQARLDSMGDAFGKLEAVLNRIDANMSALKESQDARSETVRGLADDNRRFSNEISLLASAYEGQSERVKSLESQIMGDANRPDVPSIFRLLRTMEQKFMGELSRNSRQNQIIADKLGNLSLEFAMFKSKEQGRQAVWQSLAEFFKSMMSNKAVQTVLMGGLGALGLSQLGQLLGGIF